MKKYECDGGSIMIGTTRSRTCFPNGYGDGCFKVSIVKTEEQKKKFYQQHDKWKWVGTVNGDRFYVYSYDCLRGAELDNEENILYVLSGRYGVYRNNGNIVLEKWSD